MPRGVLNVRVKEDEQRQAKTTLDNINIGPDMT